MEINHIFTYEKLMKDIEQVNQNIKSDFKELNNKAIEMEEKIDNLIRRSIFNPPLLNMPYERNVIINWENNKKEKKKIKWWKFKKKKLSRPILKLDSMIN